MGERKSSRSRIRVDYTKMEIHEDDDFTPPKKKSKGLQTSIDDGTKQKSTKNEEPTKCSSPRLPLDDKLFTRNLEVALKLSRDQNYSQPSDATNESSSSILSEVTETEDSEDEFSDPGPKKKHKTNPSKLSRAGRKNGGGLNKAFTVDHASKQPSASVTRKSPGTVTVKTPLTATQETEIFTNQDLVPVVVLEKHEAVVPEPGLPASDVDGSKETSQHGGHEQPSSGESKASEEDKSDEDFSDSDKKPKKAGRGRGAKTTAVASRGAANTPLLGTSRGRGRGAGTPKDSHTGMLEVTPKTSSVRHSLVSPVVSAPITSKLSTPSFKPHIPKWNPPGKAEKCNSGLVSDIKSPSIGLRLGLSRNTKVKPLHASIKPVH